MNWTNRLNLAAACCAAMSVFGACGAACADCCLTDWLFGTSRTTYTTPYVAPTVYAPPAQCRLRAVAQYVPPAPVYAPRATYRIAYRPVATVAYMPVTSLEPCSGCAVTTYQPRPTWTYYGSLVPYTAAYAAPAYSSCGGCSSCGCAPPSGYSSCGCSPCGCSSGGCGASGCSSCGAYYGGCSSCSAGVSYVVPGGCSSCSAGVSSGYVAPGGCSSCTAGTTVLPGPAEMSQPPIAAPMTISPTPAATLGPPALAPSAPGETPRTYGPLTSPAPIAPGETPRTYGPLTSPAPIAAAHRWAATAIPATRAAIVCQRPSTPAARSNRRASMACRRCPRGRNCRPRRRRRRKVPTA